MNQIDKRILHLIELLKQRGAIRFNKQFCDGIGMSPQHLINIKKNSRHFSPEHISAIVKTYEVNPYWILGLSDDPFAYTNAYTKLNKVE